MSKFPTRVSAARRNAEMLLSQKSHRESSLKLEQEREREALEQKTARLRELRLAKEAADRKTAGPAPVTVKRAKPRRSKQS